MYFNKKNGKLFFNMLFFYKLHAANDYELKLYIL